MIDPVMMDLNRYLANQERLEALAEACADERNELEEVQARIQAIEAMTECTDAECDELAGLYDRERELEKGIEYTMSGERWNQF